MCIASDEYRSSESSIVGVICQSHDQGCQVVADRWPARRSRLAPFAGGQTAMPPQDGAGSDQPADTQVLGQDPDERS
jgi:hypothetical protein